MYIKGKMEVVVKTRLTCNEIQLDILSEIPSMLPLNLFCQEFFIRQ